jgi:ribosome-binding protein aMBF1 (putative translation factor)
MQMIRQKDLNRIVNQFERVLPVVKQLCRSARHIEQSVQHVPEIVHKLQLAAKQMKLIQGQEFNMKLKLAQTFGQLVLNERLCRGLTQRYLANRLGVTFQFVSEIEGSKSFPSREKLINICRFLRISVPRAQKMISTEKSIKRSQKFYRIRVNR